MIHLFFTAYLVQIYMQSAFYHAPKNPVTPE